ncbi:PAS domain S-box protein [Nocardioides sp. dk4132]|uniref:ATP-binding protein n=1 Tax=unclassified Nocardioides TaxID=2615069 RepID=UPI0012959B35|nr:MULTISPECIES: ATP-binding protein [unclassified Nocardioides]MQW75504.1 PAS domain S-box protein [Nocardioides sp. dk4132]QGA08419.1 PAS domain S-box protein [Nocardioides sp. dk884]
MHRPELKSGLFRELLDAAPDPTVIVDADGTIVLVNRQVERVLGHRREELVGQPVEVLVPMRFRATHPHRREGFVRHPSARPMSSSLQLCAVHRDGHEVPVEISLSPLETESGLLVSAALRDISERRRMEAEADRLRDELIATVSHELRTPLTSVIGYSELLADLPEEEVGARARRLVEVIRRNAARELRLVDDLLTMAFLDGERLRVQRAPMDLAAMAGHVVTDQIPAARAAGVELLLEAERVPAVSGDHDRLVQVLENLLTNAVKFTPAGGRVTVRVCEHDGDPVLQVTDTGVGVEPEELPRLFERLYRTPSAVAAQVQGAGLGLSIVQKLVAAHDGTVAVESERGRGSTFRVRLRYSGHDGRETASV